MGSLITNEKALKIVLKSKIFLVESLDFLLITH